MTERSASETANSTSAPSATVSIPDKSTVISCVTRLKEWNAKNRLKTYWSIYAVHPSTVSHPDGEVLVCVLCHDLTSPIPTVRDKRKLEGYFKYNASSGCNPIRRHAHDNHKCVLDAVEAKHGPLAASKSRYKKRSREVQTTVPERLAKLPKYSDNTTTQQNFERLLSLFIAETTQSLCVVDHPRLRQLISIANARIKLPNRRTLTEKMIPNIVSDINEACVFPKINDAESITLSFDLWMSRGVEDVFDIYAHFLDSQFHPHHVHITMLRCHNADGVSLAKQLSGVIEKFKMDQKVVACVSDGGSNMRTCMTVLKDSLPSHNLTGKPHFSGKCFAHKVSLIFKHVLGPDISVNLKEISVHKVRAKLQSCITWTKKSSKGSSEWAAACGKAQLPVKKMPTPVNTRWASVVSMLSQMLSYRRAVESCFLAQSVRLQTRLPTPQDWLVVSAVVSIMKPVMNILLFSQTTSFFLLSDMLIKLVELHGSCTIQLSQLPEPATESSADDALSFEDELVSLKRSMLTNITSELYGLLNFMCNYDADSAFMYAVIALDPRFKGLGRFKGFVGGSDKLTEISEEYDSKFVIPALARCRGVVARVLEVSQPLEQNEDSGIFGEGESDDGPLDQVRWELTHFRKEKFPHGRGTKPQDAKDALKWLRDSCQKYPAVSRLARALLGIAPTQVDNERAFSVAGLVCSLRRSRLKVGTLSDLVHISLNTRAEGIFEDFETAEAMACEEMEEFGEPSTINDELNAELREENEPAGSDDE